MNKTNSKLAGVIGSKKPKENLVAGNSIPKPDTTNKQGLPAYAQDKWLTLLTMLNTLKLEPQYYRSQAQTFKDLDKLIHECAKEDTYLTCQCIVYSRCIGEGMRTISHAASVIIAPHISGQEYSKRFYGLWNKKEQKGGVIFRPDDMSEILQGYIALNGQTETTATTVTTGQASVTSVSQTTKGPKLSNAMKKGFKSVLESLDNYSLLKYKSNLIDLINLVHPNPKANPKQIVSLNLETLDMQEPIPTLDAIMRGLPIKADTWETNQSEAGQIVAKAVKEGKIDESEAKEILTQAKADNWKELLDNNKLGILAAIRNLRNVLNNKPDSSTIQKLSSLVSDPTQIRQGKIFPYQLDIANEVMLSEFSNSDSRALSQALAKGYAEAVPNLAQLIPGRNLIMLDQSGSMGYSVRLENSLGGKDTRTSCIAKAALIAATIAKATNADIIVFGSTAKYIQYNPNQDVFTLAKQLNSAHMGGTSLATAWECAMKSKIAYNRVFILSDNECNRGSTYTQYMSYVKSTGHPYVYSVDLAGYGTNAIAGDRVRYYYGYGFSMFEDIAKSEFNANYHLEKVKKVVI